MIKIQRTKDELSIILIAINMGEDLNISILGGDKPHIGAVALAVPRTSLDNDNEISTSLSLLTVTGHKEDEIVMPVAKKISKAFNSIVVVSCGIHKDNITLKEIKAFVDLVDDATEELILEWQIKNGQWKIRE